MVIVVIRRGVVLSCPSARTVYPLTGSGVPVRERPGVNGPSTEPAGPLTKTRRRPARHTKPMVLSRRRRAESGTSPYRLPVVVTPRHPPPPPQVVH